MTQEPGKDSLATRRGVLAGVGLAGLAGAITACGAAGSSSGSSAADPGASTAPAAGTGGKTATALATTAQIPVGSGTIFAAKQVVVTQPVAGEFKAFSAICTHMGCVVSQISDGAIDCPCHGSQYSIKDGAVLAGPASRPLPAEHIKVSGDKIFLE